jgi:hypothetical protein
MKKLRKIPKKHDPRDLAACSYCGIAEDIHLLDGVLVNEQDSGKIACIRCYPDSSWGPTGVEHITVSIALSLKPLYKEWLIKNAMNFKISRSRDSS